MGSMYAHQSNVMRLPWKAWMPALAFFFASHDGCNAPAEEEPPCAAATAGLAPLCWPPALPPPLPPPILPEAPLDPPLPPLLPPARPLPLPLPRPPPRPPWAPPPPSAACSARARRCRWPIRLPLRDMTFLRFLPPGASRSSPPLAKLKPPARPAPPVSEPSSLPSSSLAAARDATKTLLAPRGAFRDAAFGWRWRAAPASAAAPSPALSPAPPSSGRARFRRGACAGAGSWDSPSTLWLAAPWSAERASAAAASSCSRTAWLPSSAPTAAALAWGCSARNRSHSPSAAPAASERAAVPRLVGAGTETPRLPRASRATAAGGSALMSARRSAAASAAGPCATSCSLRTVLRSSSALAFLTAAWSCLAWWKSLRSACSCCSCCSRCRTSTPRPDGAASTSAAASAPLAPPDRRARRAFCAIRRGTAMFERRPALARTMLMSQRRFLEERAATALGETPACAAA
mmetsp:Transcript_35232/g.113637  ORF Transcript_35232/g.113637 Transcript_35232/m.113637 type:complete len:462 (+) Transcript_35232:200-1585(+)